MHAGHLWLYNSCWCSELSWVPFRGTRGDLKNKQKTKSQHTPLTPLCPIKIFIRELCPLRGSCLWSLNRLCLLVHRLSRADVSSAETPNPNFIKFWCRASSSRGCVWEGEPWSDFIAVEVQGVTQRGRLCSALWSLSSGPGSCWCGRSAGCTRTEPAAAQSPRHEWWSAAGSDAAESESWWSWRGQRQRSGEDSRSSLNNATDEATTLRSGVCLMFVLSGYLWDLSSIYYKFVLWSCELLFTPSALGKVTKSEVRL